MTPFGAKIRELRKAQLVSLKQMAADLQISAAYLSALEHGHRGLPSEALVVQICEYFHLIWDDYEEMQRLAALSHPRIVIDSSGLTPSHTALANELAHRMRTLSADTADRLLTILRTA